MEIILVNSKFSHNALFAEFKINPLCTNYQISTQGIKFFEYDKNNDDFISIGDEQIWQDEEIHKYTIQIAGGNNSALVKAKIYIESTTGIIECTCGMKADDDGTYIEKYFVDLTSLQEKILTTLNMNLSDNCKLPDNQIAQLLRLFLVDISAKNNSCDIVNIYKKYILNQNNLTITTNCGCNG